MNAITRIPFFLIVVLLFLNASTALQWSPTPADGAVIYSCAGQDVTMAWTFTLDPGNVIHVTEWNFDGLSHEMVAMSAHGNFFASPSYSHRVQLVPDVGLILNHVTTGDAGNYTVTVSGHDSSGASFTTGRTVQLHVADDLMTTDHALHAGQLPSAVYNKATQQWQTVLTCGTFTYQGVPPVSVEWLTPQSQTLPSTVYSQGSFQLFLSNPVTEGRYTCRISASALNASCSHGHGQQANIEVDGVLTRLALLEAKLSGKDEEIKELTANQQRLRADNVRLTTEVQTMEAEVKNLSSCCEAVHDRTRPSISFTASIPSGYLQMNSGDTLVLPDTLVNDGGAYNSSTGRFTAPVSGIYYFSAMSTPESNNHADLRLKSDSAAMGGRLFASFTYRDGGNFQTGSLQGALHLQQGEQVWLVTDHQSSLGGDFWTIFSGFLIFVK